MNNLTVTSMMLRTLKLCFLLLSFNGFASSQDTIFIYHDADYSLNRISADAMKMGLLTALDEVNNEIQGYKIVVKEKNHRGNIKRSLLNMRQFINDENALFVLGGLHSPPYIKNRQFINENRIPLLVPWAAGGPITRYPSKENSVFRLSIDDSKAGIRISEYALRQLDCKSPHLLLEDTPWGKSNQKTMSAYLKNKVPFGLTWFSWNTKQSVANIMVRDIVAKQYDCIFLVGNYNESSYFVNAMASLDEKNRVPIISHWGITGGDIDKIFTEDIKRAVSFSVIQSCYSLTDKEQTAFSQSVIARAKKLFPDVFTHPEKVKSPAGFIHAYDLGRIVIAAIQQIKLTDDMVQNRQNLKVALENINQPVQGLIRMYKKPFGQWDELHSDAHEALSLDNFCMAKFGSYNQVDVIKNK